MEDKVEKIEALAIGTVEGTANFMMEIGLLRNKYEKGFDKLKLKVAELELKSDKTIILMEKILEYVKR